MVIYPEVIVTPDTPTIKFSQPRDQIDLSKELPRILHAQGWGCGTLFNVMFLNHEKTKLLACGRFVVTEEVETIHTSEANPYQPMTKTVFSRQAEQIGGWWPEDLRHLEGEPVSLSMDTLKKIASGEAIVDPPLFESESAPINTTPGILPTLPVDILEPKRRGRPPKAA